MNILRLFVIGALLLMPFIAHATMRPVTNFGKVQVSTGYDSAATSIVLLSGHGGKLPVTGPFTLVWWNCTDYGPPDDDPFVEIVSANRTSDTLTVVRAQESTAASNHNIGSKVYCMINTLTKGMYDQIATDIAAAAGGSANIYRGSGSPEGVVTGAIGDIYLRTDAWSGVNVLYQKISGTGNTGWIASPDLSSPGAIGATTPAPVAATDLTANLLLSSNLTLGRTSPTYGATVAINADVATIHTITVTNTTPFTISNPTGGENGRLIVIKIVNNGGGTISFTWDTQYKMAAMTSIVIASTRWIWFISNGTNWVEAFCSPLVPN